MLSIARALTATLSVAAVAKMVSMSVTELNAIQFEKAKKIAISRMILIHKKYPSLKGYLVLSQGGVQVGLNSSVSVLYEKFPDLYLTGPPKSALEILVQKTPPESASNEKKLKWNTCLEELSQSLRFDGQVQIEMRFSRLSYEFLWQLQRDDLVDVDRTPQTKASIQIVLGTLSSFLCGKGV